MKKVIKIEIENRKKRKNSSSSIFFFFQIQALGIEKLRYPANLYSVQPSNVYKS